MKILTESDVIRIMKEEWNDRVNRFQEAFDVQMKSKVDDEEKQILSPELKVLHKKSGIRYTIDSVGPRDVILRTPENEKFLVDGPTLESEYELDLRNDNHMKSKIVNNITTTISDKLIKDAIKKSFSPILDESYVAEPKPYKQVSELVSQKTKDAHTCLYKDYVKRLNTISAELDTANRQEEDYAHSMFRSCKIDETHNLNAVWLHELYFANCFDPHSEVYMDSKSYLRLERDFGTFEDWQKDYVACALSAGEGWVICGYNIFLKRYINTFVSDHSNNTMMGFYPLVVVDMHSHSYYRDYLSDKKSYLISQMREFNWNTIEERFLKAEAINEVLK